ncbi:MFS transporter [Aspergillus heteromorphus CBS 117.55]|uniref:MFS transporter n=1 Tax=Aspergillus heteromorphus CBS 117.55 TaxID=1448321 RepID=A0A317X1Y7_9EURO|nr:MFS transporter [Aspergillus heteromorphus CBS 117.55]PWY92365.1 MFS transporter [Aspergillus heteromorphus CBS 117.55]
MLDKETLCLSATEAGPDGCHGPGSDYGPPPSISNTLVHSPTRNTDHSWSGDTNTYEEAGAVQYTRFSPARKTILVIILTFCAFLAPVSSTAILAASPEVSSTFKTTGDIIDASNALYLVSMGIAALFWSPLSQVCGRRPVLITSSILFLLFTVATALSPNLEVYFIFRICAAFQGTSFLVIGSSAVGDIYSPMTRASPSAWVLLGGLTGPAIGPFIGGIMVTFRPWRYIFWLLVALNGFAALLIITLFPETLTHKSNTHMKGKPLTQQAAHLWSQISPLRIAHIVFSYPNLFLNSLAAGTLVWNQYALLVPIRYILNPRFNLNSPIEAGLFYLAPGCGYLVGTLLGERWSNLVVRKCIRKRNGLRIPEDRLRACVPFICIGTPVCVLVYGWTVDQEIGGIPVPVIAMFLQGVCQLFCFPCLNSYCLDVMQDQECQGAEVVAANYVFRYFFAAVATGVVLPADQNLGVGWFSTISSVALAAVGVAMWFTAEHGRSWREAVDAKLRAKEEAKGHEMASRNA